MPLYLYGKVPKKIIEQCSFCKNVIVVGYLLEPEFSKSLMRHRLLIEFRKKSVIVSVVTPTEPAAETVATT